MPDTLRARIAQAFDALGHPEIQKWRNAISDAILPLVEQAIQQAREKALREVLTDGPVFITALAEKDAQIREWETGAVAASIEIVKLRQQIVALTEKADYFRESRDKNGEALDRVRAAADSLAKAIHVALAHGDRTTLGTVRGGLADAVNALSTLTLHVCGGTQARICPVTKQPHDMSAVVRFADGGSVACKDCGATAMDMDLLEMP